jgi:hypothetical protein
MAEIWKGKRGHPLGHPSFRPPFLPFISESVAAWQSSGNAERKSQFIRDLMCLGYFANRSKVGNGQWLLAGDY